LLQLLLAVGTKLEHVIAQLAYDVAEKQTAIEGDLIVTPSDQHFWFGRPRIILHLIHFILFQNAFELAFFFWILVNKKSLLRHTISDSELCSDAHD
jgi:mlo protein